PRGESKFLTEGRNAMRSSIVGAIFLLAVAAAGAQAPARDAGSGDAAIRQKQQQTSVAYRELQQAQYEAKLAEQDFLTAQEAHGAAQKQADERKKQLDAARKALDAARAKVAQARATYDEALTGVDQAWQKPAAKQPDGK